MGWSFRRSAKFGPFRLNLSKAGVGYSVGVPGARIAVSPKGRVTSTVGLPGSGLRFQSSTLQAPARTVAKVLPYHPGRPAKRSVLPETIASLIIGLIGMPMLAVAANSPLLMLAGWPIVLVGIVWARRRAAAQFSIACEAYLQELVDDFGEDAARLMVAGDPWQGATEEMIETMYGAPDDISTRVHKQLRAEGWKYVRLGADRYALRLDFENGVCVGWKTA
jgi:hypothetical protein